jgi:glutamyl-tRNA reductase
MIYLTYEDYKTIGGTLDETAFNRNIDRACAMIDTRTQSRLKAFEEIPKIVKTVCADLLEYISTNTVAKTVQSKSQSAGGVSESESYVIRSTEERAGEINDMVFDYLGMVTDDNGTLLLYRGCSR